MNTCEDGSFRKFESGCVYPFVRLSAYISVARDFSGQCLLHVAPVLCVLMLVCVHELVPSTDYLSSEPMLGKQQVGLINTADAFPNCVPVQESRSHNP